MFLSFVQHKSSLTLNEHDDIHLICRYHLAGSLNENANPSYNDQYETRALDSIGGGNLVRNTIQAPNQNALNENGDLVSRHHLQQALFGSNQHHRQHKQTADRNPYNPANLARSLDSLGGGHLVRSLDSIGGGYLLRSVPDSEEYPLSGSEAKRNLDALGGANLLKRNLDSLGGANLLKRSVDALGGANLLKRK